MAELSGAPLPPSQSRRCSPGGWERWAPARLPWRSWREPRLLPTTGEHQFSSLRWNNISREVSAQVIARAVPHSVSPGDLEYVHGPTCNLNVKIHWPGEHHGRMHLSDRYVYQNTKIAHVKRCNCFLRCRRGTVQGRESKAAPSVPQAPSQQHCLAAAGTRKTLPPILSLPTHGRWDMRTHVVLCHFPRQKEWFSHKDINSSVSSSTSSYKTYSKYLPNQYKHLANTC